MDYEIRRNPAELDSTGYMEIGPGRYSGAHWQNGFLFVWEDAFGMAEGILTRHFPKYDHFGTNDIPKFVGLKVVNDWRNAATALDSMSPGEAAELLNLAASYRTNLQRELVGHRDSIAGLLRVLANECEMFYRKSEWVCVLGM